MKWLGRFVVGLDISLDGVFEIGDGFESAPPYFPAGNRREESLDRVEPRGRRGGEVECPSRMVGEPRQDLGVFVGRVIIGDGMNDLSGGDGSFDSVQELNELLMPMLFHATPDNGSIQDVERGEQRSRAVAFVIVRHGTAFPGLEWQARLGAIERLDLAFFIDGDDDRMSRRRHIEADDILDFFGEFGIGGTLERADAMRLKAMGSPQALD